MNRRHAPRFWFSVLSLTACASRRPIPHYVRAEPVKDAPVEPVVVAIPRPVAVPGQLKQGPRPAAGAQHVVTSAHSRRPDDVIRDINRRATEGPADAEVFNAIMTYEYAPGALYQIYTAPQRLTDLQLQPGEHLVGKPAAGDTIRWILARGASLTGGIEQQHVYIKPTRPDLETTLALNTDRRSYILELHSYEDAYMAAVAWRYPQDEATQLEDTIDQQRALAAAATPTAVSVDKLNFNYEVRIVHGRPAWVPLQVFDDGHKTFIRFPAAMLDREAPALFVVSSTGDTQLVNYRVKADTYVVDRLFESAELRLGQKDQDVVHILRSR